MPNDWTRALRFALVGVANTIVDVAVFAALTFAASLSPPIASACGYTAATIHSYLWNRHWTFRDTRSDRWRREFARFAGVNLAALGMSTAVVWALAPLLGAVPAKLVSVATTFAFSYTLNRALVFQTA